MSACRPCAERALGTAARVALLVLCLVLLASCGFRKSRLLAEQGVREFHALLDKGQYDAIYDQSDDSLKKSTSRADFIAYLRNIHSRLGNSQKTSLSGYQVNTAAGQGTEVALALETEFDRGVAQERFLWRLTGGRAVLMEYSADIQRSTGPTTV